MRRAVLLLALLLACAHSGRVESLFDVRCYSGGMLVYHMPRAREPGAWPSGTWRLRSEDGETVVDVRADCVAERIAK